MQMLPVFITIEAPAVLLKCLYSVYTCLYTLYTHIFKFVCMHSIIDTPKQIYIYARAWSRHDLFTHNTVARALLQVSILPAAREQNARHHE